MTSNFDMAMKFQAQPMEQRLDFPDGPPKPVDVCPHCKVPTDLYVTTIDGKMAESHRCWLHGNVTPMKSAVSNR